VVFNGVPWDVFALQAANEYIQIAEVHSVRTRNAVRVAFWTLLPVVALLPLLVLSIAITVRVSLRPLDRIGQRAARIDLNHLRPLDAREAPEELRPFLDSINRMIERLSGLVGAERQFIANAAHELRSPISAMQLQVDNLRDAPAAEHLERLEDLQRGIRRTASLVSQLLGLARAEIGGTSQELADLPLPRIVSDVIADLLPLAIDRGVDLGALNLEELPVQAVEADLRVMIRNLVDNAIRYGGTGSRVDVSIGLEDGRAVVEVIDNGPGIAQADLARVFDRFFRGGELHEEGSGLGLSIAQVLAASYGGRVTLENRADGSTGVLARIELPRKQAARMS
jgi:two-component system OmpR family sensor kinase